MPLQMSAAALLQRPQLSPPCTNSTLLQPHLSLVPIIQTHQPTLPEAMRVWTMTWRKLVFSWIVCKTEKRRTLLGAALLLSVAQPRGSQPLHELLDVGVHARAFPLGRRLSRRDLLSR